MVDPPFWLVEEAQRLVKEGATVSRVAGGALLSRREGGTTWFAADIARAAGLRAPSGR